MAVSGFLSLDYLLNEINTSADALAAGPQTHRPTVPMRMSFDSGTTAPNAVDLIWSKRTTIAASATTNYDIAGGITDRFGGTVTFAKVVAILLVNRSTTSGDILRIGPHTSNPFNPPWTGTAPLNNCQPGASVDYPGIVFLVNPTGWTVTAGTGDSIRIVEAGGVNTVTYELMIVGRSA